MMPPVFGIAPRRNEARHKVNDRHNSSRIDRETEFHDGWARSTDLRKVEVRGCFEAPTAMENLHILREMGNLKDKRILDIGAGLGESSVYFALHGARVTTVDLSPEMVKIAHELGRLNGVELEGIVSSAESLNVRPGEYDIVYVANTIHHVTDKRRLFEQVHSALKPGGRFFSFDPVAYNPAINVYRKMANAVRTTDEAPLGKADLALARKYFHNVQHREFWILTLSLFIKYYLIDRVHPNQDRYWKRILRETSSTLWWWSPLRAVDSVLTRIPGIRWMAWNMVMWGEKPRQVSVS
jgi:2-polyprenyl-3-methyl-5-hydroxy-6-metoxy-1,4-benzoquinol methylase